MTQINELYLDLLKKALMDSVYPCDYDGTPRFDFDNRMDGRDLPRYADTMIGLKRLNNVQYCIASVIKDEIPGDLIETGIWRGGCVAFMRAVLLAYGDNSRVVWAADSFKGLPDPISEIDKLGYNLHPLDRLRVSKETVQENIRKYGLLDGNIRFLEGWFSDTLPNAPIEELAVLRLDGDLYDSTMTCLQYLYPKLQPGGYCIIDDYGALKQCGNAVRDYRSEYGITEKMEWIDWAGIFWRKSI